MLCYWLLMVVSAATAAAQARYHWTCPKEGRFVRGMGSVKYYCWDGKIYSTNTPGYTPPPKYVLDYWAEAQRNMEQTPVEIARKSQEMADKVQQAQQDNARIKQERFEQHQEFTEQLHRKIAEQRGGKPLSTNSTVLVPATPESAAIAPPVSRAKASEVQVGMDRAAVEGILGKPHGSMSISEDDGLVEVLNYTLNDKGTAKVRLEKGKVVSVKMLE